MKWVKQSRTKTHYQVDEKKMRKKKQQFVAAKQQPLARELRVIVCMYKAFDPLAVLFTFYRG